MSDEMNSADLEERAQELSGNEVPAEGGQDTPVTAETHVEMESPPLPCEESGARDSARSTDSAIPVRRSFGRVMRIQPDAVAWVADFRPLGRDVQVRLNSPWQSNPGHILEYELKLSSGGGNRWNGVDTVFNYQPDVDAVLALDEGKGLSAEGLQWLMRAIAREPRLLGRVFGPTGSLRLQQQLMEKDSFPLPRTLLLAALSHSGLAGRAAHRLWATPLRDAREASMVLRSVGARDEGPWVERLTREHADWLLQSLDLEQSQVQRAWRRTNDMRWLLQVPAAALPAQLGLFLLRGGALAGGELPEVERQAWAAHVEGEQRRRLLAAAFTDDARRAGDEVIMQAMGEDFSAVLKSLAGDPRWGEEARRRLMERGELDASSALELLRSGAEGEARLRLLEILAVAPESSRPPLDDALALECFTLGLTRLEEATGAALVQWAGGHSAVQGHVEDWLAAEETRERGLLALCHAGEFSRGRVQSLLGRPMSQALRVRLVEAISRRNPERWSERYLVNDGEAQAWREAGAPLL